MIGIISIGIWSMIAIYGLYKRNATSINVLSVMIIMQNFALVVLSKYMTQGMFNNFILVKEIYVLLLIVIRLIKSKKVTKLEVGCMISILIIFLYAILHNSGSLSGTLVSIRQLYLPFLFILLGSSIFRGDEKEIKKSISFFVKLMILCALFGWFEMIVGDKLWIKLGYADYARLKSINGLTYDTKISGAFYSWDLGFRARRMGSFLAEPVILGQLFSFSLICSIYLKYIFKYNWERYISIIILTLAILCTIAKGGIIIALFAFAFAFRTFVKEKGFSFVMKMCFQLIFILGIVYSFVTNQNGVTHMTALFENLYYFPKYPFGRGIGSVGNLGYNYGGRGNLVVNGESFIGAAIGQMGLLAVGIYAWLFINIFSRLHKCTSNCMAQTNQLILWLNVGLLLTSFINNTAISFTSCYIYYIIAGGLITISRIKGENDEKNRDFDVS